MRCILLCLCLFMLLSCTDAGTSERTTDSQDATTENDSGTPLENTAIKDTQEQADGSADISQTADTPLPTDIEPPDTSSAKDTAVTTDVTLPKDTVVTEDTTPAQDATPIEPKNCSLLAPIATEKPSNTLFPEVTHPQAPFRLDELSGPIPTNHFMGNLLIAPGDPAVYVHPYVVKLKNDAPFGLGISHSETVVTGGNGSNGAIQYYWNTYIPSMGFAMTEKVIDTQITAFDRFSVHLRQRAASGAEMTWPLVRGMAYVTSIYKNAKPIIFTQHAITHINGTPAKQGQSYSGTPLDLKLNNGDQWRVYNLNGDEPAMVLTGSQLIADKATTATLRITKVPKDQKTAVDVLDKHVGTYPTGAILTAAMHQTNENAASYSFEWQTAGNGKEPLLHFAQPHHQDILTAATQPTNVELKSTTKGMMRAYVGNRWTLREPKLTSIKWLPPTTPDPTMTSAVQKALKSDIEKDFSVPGGSYYFAGKSLYKRALLCLLAQSFEMADLQTTCVNKLKAAMQPFATNTWNPAIRYDTTWGGVISNAGLSGNKMADFGNSYYNDHHYHWGYYLQTAAILHHLDPAWGQTHKQWVETLIRDVANPSLEDKHFPHFRSFDWYSGHSWSQGLFLSPDGKDQESTSEEVHFHYGLMLWGLASNNTRLFNLGRLMLAAASRSINTYFLMTDDNKIHPPNFIANKVTGIFFENKCDYATWFGSNREFIHGIQMLPVTPITEEVRYSDFVSQEWPILKSLAANLNSGWKSILYTSYATIDPKGAFETLKTAPLDDGLTRSWALFWAATRPTPGSVKPPALPSDDQGYEDWKAVSCP